MVLENATVHMFWKKVISTDEPCFSCLKMHLWEGGAKEIFDKEFFELSLETWAEGNGGQPHSLSSPTSLIDLTNVFSGDEEPSHTWVSYHLWRWPKLDKVTFCLLQFIWKVLCSFEATAYWTIVKLEIMLEVFWASKSCCCYFALCQIGIPSRWFSYSVTVWITSVNEAVSRRERNFL